MILNFSTTNLRLKYIKFKEKVIINLLDNLIFLLFLPKAATIKNTVLFLGPYRNLTTLIAALLSLHPSCQVLNHAGIRVLPKNKFNFLKNYQPQKLRNFQAFALYASLFGVRGDFGGGIYHAHAFDDPKIKAAFFKNPLLKNQVQALVWKESLRVSNYLFSHPEDFLKILKYSQIKFILPIRNPLDCAISNLKTGHNEYFNPSCKTKEECLKQILKIIYITKKLKASYPDRFFIFYQNKLESQELYSQLAKFLGLKADPDWVKSCLEIINLKASYKIDKAFRNYYQKLFTYFF